MEEGELTGRERETQGYSAGWVEEGELTGRERGKHRDVVLGEWRKVS